MNTFNVNYKIERTMHPSFIEGRVGIIIIGDNEIGIIGEIHPEVITNFRLEVPISVFELNLTSLIGVKNL
jgi:phenylalanyl-tRNA synthetase beta chain